MRASLIAALALCACASAPDAAMDASRYGAMRFSERAADRERFETLSANYAAMRANNDWGRPVAEQRELCAADTVLLTRIGGWLDLASASADQATYEADAAALRERLAHVTALERAYLEGSTPDPAYAINSSRWNVAQFAATRDTAQDARVRELMSRAIRDQLARVVAFGESAAPFTEGLSDAAKRRWPAIVTARMAEIDCDNTAWLSEQIREHGWFDISRYGEQADEAAWLMVQHADRTPAFQGEMLALIEARANAGESDPQHMAYLWDRVAIKEGRPQRYGTQMACEGAEMRPIGGLEDPDHIEERRAALHMQTYAFYFQMMSQMNRCSD